MPVPATPVRRVGRSGAVPAPAPEPEQGRLTFRPAAAAIPLIIVSAVLAWWGWERGGYFGVVFWPGSMLLLAVLAALLLFAPWPGRLRGPALVSLTGLVGLAGWTLLSALWSPAPDVAVEDAIRVAMYAVAFVLGIWLCLLLGRRMSLALAPIAIAGSAVAVMTVLGLWGAESGAEVFETDATLRYPLGYRNAVAAFFIASVFPMLVLSSSRELDWRLSGALVATATLSLEIAVLAQSRSSVFAALIAVALLVALHPRRPRIAIWLGGAALPLLPALPWLLEVFQDGAGKSDASLDALGGACAAMALTTLVSLAFGCWLARRDPDPTLPPRIGHRLGQAAAALTALGVIALAFALATAEGGPTGFIEREADQITAGTPAADEVGGSRFGFDLRSERGDLWRVAADDLRENPIAGDGAGGFRFSYLLNRESTLQQPEDPHSVELLVASELGLPGVLLFGAFIAGAAIAGWRARRLGPSAAVLAAGGLSFAGYWLVHASVEWFWAYPSLTLPTAFALGAVAAPGLLRPPGPPRMRRRRTLALGAGLGIVVLFPLLISERFTNDALRTWRGDLSGAYDELELAADLNPITDRPLATEAVIAEAAGEVQRALNALSRAQERQPEEWTLYYLEARVLREIDPAASERALERARELNPLGPEITALERGGDEPATP